MSGRTPMARAREAFAAIEAAKARAVSEREKLGELKRRKIAVDDECRKLEKAEQADAAARILDGDAGPPEKPKRVSRIRNLRDQAPALLAAMTQQERRIADAEAAVAPLLPPLAKGCLELVVDLHGDALTQIRSAIEQMAEPVARLLAADQVLAELLGTNGFPIPSGAPIPINGSRLMEGLLKAIPDSIRPPSLHGEALGVAAHQISQPVIGRIKGTIDAQ